MRTQAKSAVRALDVLEAVSESAGGLTFMELVARSRMPKSSLFQLLAVLTDRGYLAMEAESRRYRLGIRAWELGQSYAEHRELVAEALPHLREVVAFLNETAQLSVLDGLENVYLAKVDCSHPLRLQSSVGRRLPAHATGLGKALLAHLPPEELTRRLRGLTLRRATDNTIVDTAGLLGVLASARARGFAVDNEEYTVGLRCVAVPVFDRGGAAAAISIAVPSVRATPQQLATGLRMLARASLDISRRLGCDADDAALGRIAVLADAELMRMITDALLENHKAARAGTPVRAGSGP